MTKLTNQELKQFVESSYKKKKDAAMVDGYILDRPMSSRRDKIYYDKDKNKAIHVIAGTDRFTDWFNNITIPYGLHHLTQRYKRSEAAHKEANTKYGKKNLGLITHSQSGNIAQNLTKKHLVGGEDNITLNPAIIGLHDKDLKVVKSMFDPVSLLTITNKRDEVLKPTSYNPLIEHSSKILEGRSLKNKNYNNNNTMKDYDSEDETSESGDITEDSIIKDITKLSHDIHMLFNKKKPSKKVIKGMGLLVDGIGSPRISGRGQTGSDTGNKGVDAFNDWSKAIGNKFKPLNKNLSPIKHVMTKAIVKGVRRDADLGRSKKAQVIDLLKKDIPETISALRNIGKGRGLYTSTAAAANPISSFGGGLYTSTAANANPMYGRGRPKKGSPEAKAWGEKMRAARRSKA